MFREVVKGRSTKLQRNLKGGGGGEIKVGVGDGYKEEVRERIWHRVKGGGVRSTSV